MNGEDRSPASDPDGTPGPATSPEDREAPLAHLVADVDARRNRMGKGYFEAVEPDPGASEARAVWNAVGDDEGSDTVGEVLGAEERTYVVSKRDFCERCRHFSEPPEVHCTHEGTEVSEFVDRERVRLSSCPVVEARGIGYDGVDD